MWLISVVIFGCCRYCCSSGWVVVWKVGMFILLVFILQVSMVWCVVFFDVFYCLCIIFIDVCVVCSSSWWLLGDRCLKLVCDISNMFGVYEWLFCDQQCVVLKWWLEWKLCMLFLVLLIMWVFMLENVLFSDIGVGLVLSRCISWMKMFDEVMCSFRLCRFLGEMMGCLVLQKQCVLELQIVRLIRSWFWKLCSMVLVMLLFNVVCWCVIDVNMQGRYSVWVSGKVLFSVLVQMWVILMVLKCVMLIVLDLWFSWLEWYWCRCRWLLVLCCSVLLIYFIVVMVGQLVICMLVVVNSVLLVRLLFGSWLQVVSIGVVRVVVLLVRKLCCVIICVFLCVFIRVVSWLFRGYGLVGNVIEVGKVYQCCLFCFDIVDVGGIVGGDQVVFVQWLVMQG